MFGINTTRDISKLSQISLDAREITYNNFEQAHWLARVSLCESSVLPDVFNKHFISISVKSKRWRETPAHLDQEKLFNGNPISNLIFEITRLFPFEKSVGEIKLSSK